METKIKDFAHTKTFTGILLAIGALIVILIIFQAGVFVGYKRAQFSGRFGDNYRQAFGESREGNGPGMMGGFFGGNLLNDHGAVGKIIKVSLPTIVVIGPDNIERVVLIDNNTQIVQFRQQIQPSDLKVDDSIVVIGEPNNSSQIEAKLIRVMPTPMNFSTTTPIGSIPSTQTTQ